MSSASPLTGASAGPEPPDLLAETSLPGPLRVRVARAWLRLGVREVYGDLDSLEGLTGSPLIFLPNHVCGWDVAVMMLVADQLDRRLIVAGAPRLLERFPLLKRFGFFPIARGTPLRTARQLRALGRRIDEIPDAAFCIFPQGGHVRVGIDVPPKRGALEVASATSWTQLVPVALHYELFEAHRPVAWVKALPPVSSEDGREGLQRILRESSAALADDLRAGTSSYRPLLREDPRTVLLANVPCDRRRLDAALHRAGLNLSFADVERLEGARLAELRPQAVAAVRTHMGPLYGDCVNRTLAPAQEESG